MDVTCSAPLTVDGVHYFLLGDTAYVQVRYENRVNRAEYNELTLTGNLFSLKPADVSANEIRLSAVRAGADGEPARLTINDVSGGQTIRLSVIDPQQKTAIVTQLQDALHDLKCWTGFPTGLFNEQTKTALIQYRTSVGLSATATLSETEWNDLMRAAEQAKASKVTETPAPASSQVKLDRIELSTEDNAFAYGADGFAYLLTTQGYLLKVDPKTGSVSDTALPAYQGVTFEELYGGNGGVIALDSDDAGYVFGKNGDELSEDALGNSVAWMREIDVGAYIDAAAIGDRIMIAIASEDYDGLEQKTGYILLGDQEAAQLMVNKQPHKGIQAIAACGGTAVFCKSNDSNLYFIGQSSALTQALKVQKISSSAAVRKEIAVVNGNNLNGGKIQSIQISETNIVLILNNGDAYIGGTNLSGILGAKETYRLVKASVGHVRQAALVEGTVYLLTEDGELYSFGTRATDPLSSVRAIAANGSQLCVLTMDNQLILVSQSYAQPVKISLNANQ